MNSTNFQCQAFYFFQSEIATIILKKLWKATLSFQWLPVLHSLHSTMTSMLWIHLLWLTQLVLTLVTVVDHATAMMHPANAHIVIKNIIVVGLVNVIIGWRTSGLVWFLNWICQNEWYLCHCFHHSVRRRIRVPCHHAATRMCAGDASCVILRFIVTWNVNMLTGKHTSYSVPVLFHHTHGRLG